MLCLKEFISPSLHERIKDAIDAAARLGLEESRGIREPAITLIERFFDVIGDGAAYDHVHVLHMIRDLPRHWC